MVTFYFATFSFIILALYLILMAATYGVQSSVSDNYYASKNRWAFLGVMWLTAFCMLPALFSVTPDNWKFSAFLTCGGLVFVGAAAAFKEDLTKNAHYFGAILSAACALIWLAVQLPTLVFLFLVFLLAVVILTEYRLYWLEVLLFLYVYATYFYRALL